MGKQKRRNIVGIGLPQKYRDLYGESVEFKLYSREAWNKFNKSPEGKLRLTYAQAQEVAKIKEIGAREEGPAPKVARTQDDLKDLVEPNANAVAKAIKGSSRTAKERMEAKQKRRKRGRANK